VAQNESAPRLDRRHFLKVAVAPAIVAPAKSGSEPEFAASTRPSGSDEPGRKERAMSTGGFSRSRLEGINEVMADYVKRGDLPGARFPAQPAG